MREEAKSDALATLTVQWSHIEVPRGCYVATSPVFTYRMSASLNSESGMWVVATTAFTAQTAAFILWDWYDNYHLWPLSPKRLENLCTLDLRPMLGNDQNVEGLLRLLMVIEDTDFHTL